MDRLKGKVAIITGGSRGMGASHAKRFIKEGAKVVFTDILVEEGEALARELGENARFIKHDVTKLADWEHVVSETEAAFGPVTVLVNNAGISFSNSIEEMTEEQYMKVIQINQVSVFLGMKSVIPSMKKANGGSIVNISSMNGIIGFPGSAAYDSSKFAVRGMTKSAALELSPFGIRVNSVHPGVIETPMVAINVPEEIKEELKKNVPLARLAKPEEVTNLVLYLASDEASYSTGSEFIVDGGYLAK